LLSSVVRLAPLLIRSWTTGVRPSLAAIWSGLNEKTTVYRCAYTGIGVSK